MPQDDLAHNLYGSAGSRGVCRRVPSQIVRSNLDAYPVACPFHHISGGSVLDREYATVGVESTLPNVILETLGNLLRDEDQLLLFSALGVSENELLILYVSRLELQNLADAESSACHEFHNQTISDSRDLEDHLIYGFLVQGVPTGMLGGPEELP